MAKTQSDVQKLAENTKATDPKAWNALDFNQVQAVGDVLKQVLLSRKDAEIARLRAEM